MSSIHLRYRNDARTKAARRLVLARAEGVCELRITGVCTVRATTMHHMDGANEGNYFDTTRMQAACRPCNTHVGDPSKHDPPPRIRTTW